MVIEQGMGDELRDQVFHEDNGGMMFDRMTHERPYSDDTARLIDQEVEKLIKEAAHRAEVVIANNMKSLEALAKRLLKDETVDEVVVEEVFKNAVLPKEAKLY